MEPPSESRLNGLWVRRTKNFDSSLASLPVLYIKGCVAPSQIQVIVISWTLTSGKVRSQFTMPSGTCFMCKSDRRLSSLSSYFNFPLDIKRRHEWCKLLCIDIHHISKNTVICNQHFNSHQFVNKQRLRLRKNALPDHVSIKNRYQVIIDICTFRIRIFYS